MLKNAWPCDRCSPSFSNELLVVSWLVVLSPLHALWWVAYKDRSHSNYEKVLPETNFLQHHDINDRTQYETIDFLFRPSDIYRHIAQPYVLSSVCLQLACCSVLQFSWFVAVSRPFLDSCSVSPDGALLVSQFDPGIKLTFPPECTTETRIVTMQVCTWMYYAVCVINLY